MNIFQRITELQANGDPAALCTVTQTSGSVPRHAGAKMLVLANGEIEGTIGGGEMENRVRAAALEVLTSGKPQTLSYTLNDPAAGDPGVCGGTMEVFVEPIKGEATLVVVGAGHVGQAVAHLADWLGFRVEVSDDRPDYCRPEVVPEAAAFHPVQLAELPTSCDITDQTYIVLCTRNVEVDIPGIPALLETPAAYIGVIGSKRRWATARKKLEQSGVDKVKLDRIVSPMGLEIMAETPQEIAVSILSEILMRRRGGDGKPMSD
ncbi:MAG: XdhC family protein [Chloroflexi bacterium]|nr:XdhC family protein [Chloroflexota bacterium]MQC26957.1 XdhC family protein [Chloroflexota bacterium]